MVQDVGGRDMKLRPVKSGAPWRYVDVGGYYSGGLRFRHIQSPDFSGLFAFLGLSKTTHGNTLGNGSRYIELGRVLILCSFGRLGECPDASINPLGYVSFRMAKQ